MFRDNLFPYLSPPIPLAVVAAAAAAAAAPAPAAAKEAKLSVAAPAGKGKEAVKSPTSAAKGDPKKATSPTAKKK